MPIMFAAVLAAATLADITPKFSPQFPPTWDMQQSTWVMACNYSSYMLSNITAAWGVVDLDWSNGKETWANESPMNAEEMLLKQAAMIKAEACPKKCPLPNGCTRRSDCHKKVWVYRNGIKALPWFTSVREKLEDPAYSGFFIKFNGTTAANGTIPTAHVPACDSHFSPAKCSSLYHDQVQTPQYPKGSLLDGSCSKPCDCGLVPCGEYVFDHRNGTMLQQWFVEEYFGGDTALGNANVDGFYIDDAWLPQHGRNGSIPGGPSEMDRHSVQDMGLSEADISAIYKGWEANVNAALTTIVAAGGWAGNMLKIGGQTMPTDPSTCVTQLRSACPQPEKKAAASSGYTVYNLPHGPNVNHTQQLDMLAAYLLTRGPYGFIGHGWEGSCNVGYDLPDEYRQDYGVPNNNCTETNAGSGVFTREWSQATVKIECSSLTATITMK